MPQNEVHNWYVSDSGFDIKKYLEERVQGQLAYFNQKSASEKRKFMRLQWTLIICSALTPLFGSVAAFFRDHKMLEGIFLAIALTNSVVVAIVANAIKTFKSQENWLNNRATCEMLHREKFLFEAGVPPYDNEANRNRLFVKRVEDMLAREQNQWLTIAQPEKSDG